MRRTKTTTALALTGAVALASGAYALGSQAGDGDAVAAKNANPPALGYGGPPPGRPGHGWRGGGPPMLDGLADRLGVDESDLQAALEDLRKDHGDDFAQQLADALGIDVSKVTAAFDKLRPRPGDRHADFAAALAKKLGVSTAAVRKAFDQGRRDPQAVAKALGVTPEKLRQAFESLRPRHHRRGPDTAAMAKALGVSQAKLKAALDKVEAAEQQERDAFAKELADRLNIDVQKVEDALADLRPPRFGERHHP
jgi:DNA-binding MarR family transcriptional regulator